MTKKAEKSYYIFFITLREMEWVKADENKELIFYANRQIVVLLLQRMFSLNPVFNSDLIREAYQLFLQWKNVNFQHHNDIMT